MNAKNIVKCKLIWKEDKSEHFEKDKRDNRILVVRSRSTTLVCICGMYIVEYVVYCGESSKADCVLIASFL